MTMFTRRDVAAGLLAGAMSLTPRAGNAAGKPMTVASLFGEDKPETRIWVRISQILGEKLPGRFDIRIVGNAALGGEKEVAEGIRLGSIQASLSTISALSPWVPEGQILDLPFVFRDRAHLKRVLAGPLGAELKARYEAQGFVVLAFVNYGARHLLAKEPVTSPADMAGKRIRVIQSPLHAELWKGFGANPTPIPIPETYNALKTGIVDMMDLTKSAYAGFKLYEVVPYLIETGHIWAAGVVMVSGAFWRGLDAGEKAAFAAAAVEGAAVFDELIVADEETSMRKAMAEGARVIVPADRAAWEAGARKVWTTFAPKLGGIGKVEAIAGM